MRTPDRSPRQRPLQILAISGSLRASSKNTALLRLAMKAAPEGILVAPFSNLADLPHFNPDLDGEQAPLSVMDFRRQLAAADGILISCPEYAHGVPGVMKNALDWTVGSGEFVNKPVALLSATSRSTWAQASLKETLNVMMAQLSPEASIMMPSLTPDDRADQSSSPGIVLELKRVLTAFAHTIRKSKLQLPMQKIHPRSKDSYMSRRLSDPGSHADREIKAPSPACPGRNKPSAITL